MKGSVSAAAIALAAILSIEWPDEPRFERVPALSLELCREAAAAYRAGRALPLYLDGRPYPRRYAATRADCVETDPAMAGFWHGWGCIVGYNC